MKNADKPVRISFVRKDFDSDKDYRDYLRTSFALAAMEGIIKNPEVLTTGSVHYEPTPTAVANRAIKMADELLKQLDS